MSKTTELDKYFETIWMKRQCDEPDESLKLTMIENPRVIEKDFFCKDGIVDEQTYTAQRCKVLFIANEPNIEDARGVNTTAEKITSQVEAFKDYQRKEYDDWSGKLRERICSILYPAVIAAMNEESISKYPVEKGWENASKIAFMNLNKRGGRGRIIDNHLTEYCKYYKEQIEEEISIIEPTIIVWLGKASYESCTKIFDIKDNNITIKGKTIRIIQTYHTSYFRISHYKRGKILEEAVRLAKTNHFFLH